MRFAPASFACEFDQLQVGWYVRLVGDFPPPFASNNELLGVVSEVSEGNVGIFIRLGVGDCSYLIWGKRVERVEVLETRNAIFVASRQPL